MSYYRICPRCGAKLDPGEVCGCWGLASTIQEARDLFPEDFIGKADFEVIRGIADSVRRVGLDAEE